MNDISAFRKLQFLVLGLGMILVSCARAEQAQSLGDIKIEANAEIRLSLYKANQRLSPRPLRLVSREDDFRLIYPSYSTQLELHESRGDENNNVQCLLESFKLRFGYLLEALKRLPLDENDFIPGERFPVDMELEILRTDAFGEAEAENIQLEAWFEVLEFSPELEVLEMLSTDYQFLENLAHPAFLKGRLMESQINTPCGEAVLGADFAFYFVRFIAS